MNIETMHNIPPEIIENGVRSNVEIDIGTSMTVMLISYLLIVLKIGPAFMKSRPAYELKTWIFYYNIYQIIACFYAIARILMIDLPALAFGECIDIEPGSPAEKDFNHIANFLFWLKGSELTETIVFVLRKKQQQVSFLHVFHHAAMLFLSYNLNVVYRNSATLFPVFLNSCVHVIMYTYYLMAAELPAKVVAKLTPFKKAITTIQMIQFTIILLQIVFGLSKGCKVPKLMLMIYTVIICVIFYGFYDFYKKSYTEKQQKRT